MKAAGLRTKLVGLEAPGAPLPDPDGGYTETFAALDPPTAWAAIEPASATDLERLAAGTVITTASHLITLPFHPGITIETRISYPDPRKGRTRTFQITGLTDPDERNRELVIVAEEILQ
jgi:head-tail adaptor